MADDFNDLATWFLSSSASEVLLETLEISHPNFSKTYYLVRNARLGVTVRHENGKDYFHEYVPMRLRKDGARTDLDYGISIDLGEMGEIIAPESDRLRAADGFMVKPVVIYRTYRSAALTETLEGPRRLEIENLSHDPKGCSFTAAARKQNINRTGRVYTMDDFPSLRGFL